MEESLSTSKNNVVVEVEEVELETLSGDLALVLNYWRSITPEGAIGPSWHSFDLLELPAQLLPRTLVVDHNMQTGAMMYRFWGSALSDVFGADYSGKSFDELPDVFRPVAYGTYKLVLEVRKPIQVRFKVKVGNRFTDFQSAFRLPLSDDGVNVTGVVSLLDQNFPKHDWDRLKDEFLSLKAE